MHRPRRRRLGLTTTAIAVTSAVGACGPAGDDGQTGADPSTSTTVEATTTAPPETTTTAPTPEEEVLAAYQGYWAAVDEAFGPPRARARPAGVAPVRHR